MRKEIAIRTANGVGRITLQRPKALHALSYSACTAILDALATWTDDPNVELVMVDHEQGTRGFCAGGDIRMLAESGAADAADGRNFFAAEYRMNVAVNRFPKPYLALMDGVTMGGGVGISVHGSHRVATENTILAMPETGIGLFPDVGAGWFLPRLSGETGTWLGLTGSRLKGTDVVAVGVATHFVSSDDLFGLKADILSADLSSDASATLDQLLANATRQVPDASYAKDIDTINRCFVKGTVEEIVAALKADGGDWAAEQLELLATKSPETLKVALRQMREGARCKTFEQNMQMEYRIAWRKIVSSDFIEGVRAVIIDKDHNPKWSPATLEEVSDEDVARYFEPLGKNELDV